MIINQPCCEMPFKWESDTNTPRSCTGGSNLVNNRLQNEDWTTVYLPVWISSFPFAEALKYCLRFWLPLQGETNRVIAEHSLNKNSSRSHCIFTIYIEVRAPAVIPGAQMTEDPCVAGFHSLFLPTAKYSPCSFPPQSRCRAFSEVRCINSKINLIDLAGSERLSKTGVSSGRNIWWTWWRGW